MEELPPVPVGDSPTNCASVPCCARLATVRSTLSLPAERVEDLSIE